MRGKGDLTFVILRGAQLVTKPLNLWTAIREVTVSNQAQFSNCRQ